MNGQYIAGKRLTVPVALREEKQPLPVLCILTELALNSVNLCNYFHFLRSMLYVCKCHK